MDSPDLPVKLTLGMHHGLKEATAYPTLHTFQIEFQLTHHPVSSRVDAFCAREIHRIPKVCMLLVKKSRVIQVSRTLGDEERIKIPCAFLESHYRPEILTLSTVMVLFLGSYVSYGVHEYSKQPTIPQYLHI